MGAYTGALVGTEAERDDIGRDKRAHAAFLRDMQEKCRKCWHKGKVERQCDDISIQWPGAAPPPLRVLCDEYFAKCFDLWDEHARKLTDSLASVSQHSTEPQMGTSRSGSSLLSANGNSNTGPRK